MNDTSLEAEYHFSDMMMKKSGQERLKMGFSMFDMARRQIVASVKMNKPDADVQDLDSPKFCHSGLSGIYDPLIFRRFSTSGNDN